MVKSFPASFLKSFIVILFVFIFLIPDARAEWKFAERWSWQDTSFQSLTVGFMVADWLQTRTMAKNNWYLDGKQYREFCPLLPDHPNTSQVDLYFAGCALGHTIIALALPPEGKIWGHKVNPRRIWQGVWIGIEAGFVGYNYSVGVRIEL